MQYTHICFFSHCYCYRNICSICLHFLAWFMIASEICLMNWLIETECNFDFVTFTFQITRVQPQPQSIPYRNVGLCFVRFYQVTKTCTNVGWEIFLRLSYRIIRSRLEIKSHTRIQYRLVCCLSYWLKARVGSIIASKIIYIIEYLLRVQN